MKDARNTQGRGSRGVPVIALAVWVAVALGLLGAGCTSDPADLVGAGLIETRIDSTLLELDIRTIDQFAGLRVDNDAVPLTEQQTLYLGTEQDTRASFLVNFDLADRDQVKYPAGIFTTENIRSVKLSLTKLNYYGGFADSLLVVCDSAGCDTTVVVYPEGDGPRELYYYVHQLLEAYDPDDFLDYPAQVPAFNGTIIVQNFEVPVESDLPTLTMYENDVINWISAGVPVGILVQFGPQTEPGLVGHASGDLTTFSEIPNDAVGTIPGPNLIIEFDNSKVDFDDPKDYFLLVGPDADTTVWEEVTVPPTDLVGAGAGFNLRTGLRSYPAFQYTMANLPPNARINRAVLSVVNDTASSYGPPMSIQVSEVVPAVIGNPTSRIEVATMLDSTLVYPLTFRSNVRPNTDARIEFDVTYGLQRIVNSVNEEVRGLILSGIEDKRLFFPSPDVTLPDFYYRQWNFLGLDDPDVDNRPYLKVWYSVDGDLSGGGE